MPRSKTRSKAKLRREVIPQPDRNMSLSQAGYLLSNSAEKRKKAIQNAVNKYGYAAVLRRIKLIYALTPNSDNKHKAKKDMKFMTNFHDNRKGSE